LKDEERFALAERIQKKIRENHPHFQFIKRRAEIEKQFEVKIEKTLPENTIREDQTHDFGYTSQWRR